MDKKLLFIFNLRAGKSLIKTKLASIIDIFVKGGYEVVAHPTQDAKDAYETVKRDANKYDMIVCSGGDGTLDEVVTGLMDSKCNENTVLGYIPAGSTNDFARSLKIPKDMIKAANRIISGKEIPCDVGDFNGDTFVYVAAFGLFTDVSYKTSQELKNVLGHLAYVLEGVKRLSAVKYYRLKVRYNDVEIEDNFIYGMVSNSTSIGGFKNMTGKNVHVNDGLYEVTLIKTPESLIELQDIVTSLLLEVSNEKYILTFKTDKIEIESEEDIAWTLDGEFGGEFKEVSILNRKQALRIMR